MNISAKIKLIRSIMWGYIFLLLIVVPMLVDHFVTTPISGGKVRFDSASWCTLLVGAIIISIVATGWAMRHIAYHSKDSPANTSLALYLIPGSPAGFCALLTVLLILFNLEVFGLPPWLMIWICIFIFGSFSIYSMKLADRLVEKILFDYRNQGGQ